MAVAEISLEPVGTCSASISDIITESVKMLKGEPNVRFDVTAMGTIVEGDAHQILSLAECMREACFKAGATRVITTIRLDERRDKAMSMQEMEREVEQRLAA